MIETIIDAIEILKKYDLEVEEIEPAVYKVLNTDKEVNISKLQWDLRQCSLLISAHKTAKRMPDGYAEYYSRVYYVVIGCNYELVEKYEESLCGDVALMNYDYTDFLEPCISTLYEKKEIEAYE